MLYGYLNSKQTSATRLDANTLTVSDVLTVYAHGPASKAVDPVRIGYAIDALDEWWGDFPIAEITQGACQDYAEARGKAPGTIRRELGCLGAAINHTMPNGVQKPKIWMPPKPAARAVWLTRSEAARLIRAARRNPKSRHLAKFILIALYTGSRTSVILGLKYNKHDKGGWADLEKGLLHRKAENALETKKKAPPIPIPERLLHHMRRWRRSNTSGWLVEFQGRQVGSLKTAWNTVKREAELPDITRHTLRHTAITWAMQSGIDRYDACAFFGISWDTLEQTYGHHHPNYLQHAAAAVGRGGRRKP